MSQYLENKKIIDEFIELSTQSHTPFRFTGAQEDYFRKLAEIICYENTFKPRGNRLAAELDLNPKTITRAKQFCLKWELIEIINFKTDNRKIISYPRANIPKFKEYLEISRNKAEIEKTEKLKKCGSIDIMWSTDHSAPNRTFLRQKGTFCPTNINNTIKDKEYNINLCNSENDVDQKLFELSPHKITDNQIGTKNHSAHELHMTSVNEDTDGMIDFSTDHYTLADDMTTNSTQGVVLKDNTKFFYDSASSDNGTYTNASLEKTIVLSHEIPIPDDFYINETNKKYAIEEKNLTENQLNQCVKGFFLWAKNKKSFNWNKTLNTFIKKYNPNKSFIYTKNDEYAKLPAAANIEYGSHNPYQPQPTQHDGSLSQEIIDICKPKPGQSWRDRQKRYEKNIGECNG